MDALIDDIDGKTALITGASSGIGRAVSLRLAKAGVTISGVGRSSDALNETCALIDAQGGTFYPVQADIARPGNMEASVEQAAEQLGQIDILVNNAGIMATHVPGVTERTRWQSLLNINLMAAIEGCEAVIKHMREGQISGRIVNVTSLASRLPGGGVYGASKLALEKYTHELRASLENDPIRASMVIPGGFSTNLGRDMSENELTAFQKNTASMMDKAVPDNEGRTPYFGIADDVARAIHFAIAQPDYVNVSELVVRPARNIDPSAFLE